MVKRIQIGKMAQTQYSKELNLLSHFRSNCDDVCGTKTKPNQTKIIKFIINFAFPLARNKVEKKKLDLLEREDVILGGQQQQHQHDK